jgi:uncharacterized protein (TIGR00255 family)
MAISGMTGFGRAEGEAAGVRWIWEAKSVNGRGLDVKTRLPPGWDAFEPLVREAAGRRFKRGALQTGLTLRRSESQSGLRLDVAFLASMIAAGQTFVDRGLAQAPRWDGLLALRGAFVDDEDDGGGEAARADLEAAVRLGLDAALEALDTARRNEGAMLAETLSVLVGRLDALIAAARNEAGAAPQAALERLRTRLEAIAPELRIDPQRLAQEAALIAARADVAEELERLTAHAGEARALIASHEPAGRRLDFLSQELTREANTLCSKSNDLALTRIGLDLKTAIDQLKEQAANVE